MPADALTNTEIALLEGEECGPLSICPPDCAIDHDRVAREGFDPILTGMENMGDAPTAKQLELHAQRYGSEGVQEIADAFGLTIKIASFVKQPKPKSRKKLAMTRMASVGEGVSW